MKTRINVLKSYVWPIMLYGCETWTISKIMKAKLEAAEIWFYRRMLKIGWTEKKTNIEVMQKAGVKRNLLSTIVARQMEFFGHVMRREGLEKIVTTGKIEGKRDRGRQRQKYLDGLNNLNGGNFKIIELIRATEDRNKWRFMIANAVQLHGN